MLGIKVAEPEKFKYSEEGKKMVEEYKMKQIAKIEENKGEVSIV